MSHHNRLKTASKYLPDDYESWGTVVRWEDPNQTYPDCSCGCVWFYPLANKRGEPIGNDWGVCANPSSHRCGLLTFEHQGCQKAEPKRR